MEQGEKEELEALYKELSKRRVYILSMFDNDYINDDDYFYYGIYYDLINNAYNIVLSKIVGYSASLGVDISARTMIEALIILEINKKGKIDSQMKRIYRLSYSAVEKDNEVKIKEKDILNEKDLSQREKDYQELIETVCDYFGCSKNELLNTYSISDPYLYLLKDIDDKTNFLSIAKKYDVDIDSFIEPYSFFSVMIHPRFLSPDQEKELEPQRDEYLSSLLGRVKDLFKEDQDKVKNLSVNDLNWQIRMMSKSSMDEIKRVTDLFIRYQKLLPKDLFSYLYYYIYIIEPLILDIHFSYYLKNYDLVIPKFKSFIETTSVFLHFYHAKDQKDIYYQSEGLRIGSEYRFSRWLKSLNTKERDNQVEKLFFSYYNKRYSINGVGGFTKNLENEPLYFIKDKNCSFHSLVRSENSSKYLSDSGPSEVSSLYEVALDMCHASGFTFNQSQEVLFYFSSDCLSATFSYLSMVTSFFEYLIQREDPSFKGFKGELDFLSRCIKNYDSIAKKSLKDKK